ncbi:MAG: acyl-CoA dehydrogenase family protein [Candidatus Thorarchaeota archaeon]|jgi:alkylation response protein AidB-like acyl-CoA dehydrogenase/acyl dehydratase/putative sterol carrier protein
MTQMNDDELLYTKDELEFRLKVRKWAETEITPLVDTITSPDFDYRRYFKKLGNFGLSGLLIPKKYGGSEKPFMYQLIAGEEISAICPSATMMFGASCTLSAIPILRYGSEEQKEKYLVPIAKGEKIGALAITEPKVGSDTAGMVTTAKWDQKQECWILNGEKRYITNASIADQIVVFAITDPTVDSKSGMSAFIIETSWDGFKVEKDFNLMGRDGVRITQFSLDNLKVPKENLLGKQNQGFLILMNELDSERIGIAAEALGCMRTPFEIAVAYSQEREQFGRPISRFEGISFKVADMAVKMRAARLLMISAARMIQKDIPCTKEATIAKLYASEVSVECCDMAIQICGGAGYVTDFYPLEKFYRDARLGTIGGGTSEILRFLIQREVYIESRRDFTVQLSQDVDALDFDTMMTSIPNGFRPDRAEGVSAVIRFSFEDTDSWLLSIVDQKCAIEKGDTENPKMTLKTDSATWRNILLGKLDAMQAMMTEKVIIDTDDMELLMKFARMFRFTPEILRGVTKPEEQTKEQRAPESSKFELGKSLDEIEIGEKAESSMIVSDDHIQLYAQMSGDYNALHMDDDYAATTMFGKRIAHGPIGGALVARVIGTQLPGLGTLAFNMKVNFKAPVYPGDEIKAVVEVTEKVPDNNLCRLTFDVYNDDGVVVMDGYANVMPPLKE